MAKLVPLTEEETFGYADYTHAFIIDAKAGDLTMATVSTEQVFTPFTTKDQDQILKAAFILTESFENTADAAYNTTTIRVGDANDDDQFVVAAEMNKNGTVVTAGYATGDANPTTYTSAVGLKITIGTQTGKAIANLNKGRVVVLFKILRPGLDLKNRGFLGS